MQASVRRKVFVDRLHNILEIGDAQRTLGFLEVAFNLRIPTGKQYHVRYSLNPEGRFIVEHGGYVRKVGVFGYAVAVCFIPSEWDGLRVSRKAWVPGGNDVRS